MYYDMPEYAVGLNAVYFPIVKWQDPEPAEAWIGIREATNFSSSCTQFDILVNQIVGSEDCLYLNVYTKSIQPNLRRPVMVWIHGGAFVFGDGSDLIYGPDYFLRKDIVFVTINYRLAVLGLLTFIL